MQPDEFLDRLEAWLVPQDYRRRITDGVNEGWRVYRQGPYLFAAVPYSEVPTRDYPNSYVKGEIRRLFFTFPFFAEKGLFLLHYGPSSEWGPHCGHHKVDKTALRPVIMQSIHFVDPQSGENYNTRTAWGPIQFGFCGQVIQKIEDLCGEAKMRAGSEALPDSSGY